MLFRPQVDLKRRPLQERAHFTFQVLLEAAERIIVSEGMSALKMAHVAEVAGVGAGTMYQYFDDRSSLLVALLERHSRLTLEALLAMAKADSGQNLEELLRQMSKYLVETIFRHRALKELVYHELKNGPAIAMDDMSLEFANCMTAALTPYVAAERISIVSQLMVFAADGMMEGVIRKESQLDDCALVAEAVARVWLALANPT